MLLFDQEETESRVGAERSFFGLGESVGEGARFSGRDWRLLLSEAAELDMRRVE